MPQLRPVSTTKQNTARDSVFVQRATFDRRKQERISGLRQVEEFGANLKRIKRSAYLCGGALLILSLVCVDLSFHHVDVIALFASIAVVLLIQLGMIGADYFHEGKRASQAYWYYLDTFSYKVIQDLRKTSRLSDWSRYEVDKYLSAMHL